MHNLRTYWVLHEVYQGLCLDHRAYGEIVEKGTHNELMEARGAYYRLVKSQYDAIRKAVL